MRTIRLSALARQAVLALAIGPLPPAMAQVPPHPPGTICFTPQYWCWASPPGPSGAACVCPSPYGRVAGRLG